MLKLVPVLTGAERSQHVGKRTKPQSASVTGDGDFVIDDNRVVWKVGTHIHKSFTLPSRVLQVVHCTFADFQRETREKYVCVLLNESISVFGRDGDVYSVTLPCKVHKMYQMLEGLLLERASVHDMLSETPASSDPDENAMYGGDGVDGVSNPADPSSPLVAMDWAPVFFSLMHPLEEIKPVSSFSFRESESARARARARGARRDEGRLERTEEKAKRMTDSTASDDGANEDEEDADMDDADYLCDVNERIVHVCPTQPLMVTHNLMTRTHSVWLVRQSHQELLKRASSSSSTGLSMFARSPNVVSGGGVRMDVGAVSVGSSSSPSSGLFALGKQSPGGRRRSVGMHKDASKQAKYASFLDGEASPMHRPTDVDEDSDDDLRSEVFVEKVWTQQNPVPRCSSAFLCSDVYGEPLLCLFSQSLAQLTALKLSRSPTSSPSASLVLSPAFDLRVKGVVPIFSGRNLLFQPVVNKEDLGFGAFHAANGGADDARVGSGVRGACGGDGGLATYTEIEGGSAVTEGCAEANNVNPYNFDLLVIEMDGALALYTGNARVCSVQFTGSSLVRKNSPTFSSLSMSLSLDAAGLVQIVSLEKPMHDRVTVVNARGQSQRCFLSSFASLRSPSSLTFRCLRVLYNTLSAPLAHALRCDFLACLFAVPSGNTEDIDPAVVWSAFCWLMKAHLRSPRKQRGVEKQGVGVRDIDIDLIIEGGDRGHSGSARNENVSRENVGDVMWEQLLSCARARSVPEDVVLTCTDLACRPGAPSSSESLRSCWERVTLQSDRAAFRAQLPTILTSLHLLYEESKLRLHAIQQMKPLGALLSSLAGAMGAHAFVDHYERDWGFVGVADMGDEVGMEMEGDETEDLMCDNFEMPRCWQRPFSIMHWLSSCLEVSPRAREHPSMSMSSDERIRRSCLDQDMLANVLLPSSEVSLFLPSFRLLRLILLYYDALFLCEDDTRSVFSHVERPHRHRLHVPIFSTPATTPFKRRVERNEDTLHVPSSAGMTISSVRSLHPALAVSGSTPLAMGRFVTSSSRRISIGGVSMASFAAASSPASLYPVLAPASVTVVTPAWCPSTAPQRMVRAMIRERFTMTQLDLLPFGVALPLREALHECRENPTSSTGSSASATDGLHSIWPQKAYLLIGREDLARIYYTSSLVSTGSGSSPLQSSMSRGGAPDSSSFGDFANIDGAGDENAVRLGADVDGTARVALSCRLRFGRDRRIKEVRRLLRAKKYITVRMGGNGSGNVDEGDGTEDAERRQKKLLALLKRTSALPLARGMFTLSSISPILTQILPIPAMSIEGILPPKLTKITLEEEHIKPGAFDWPSFHNGVAAGLRVRGVVHDGVAADGLSGGAGGLGSQGPTGLYKDAHVTRTWIVYNRPNVLNHEHAGLLFALGLQGHLSALSPSDFYWYLSQSNNVTTVAVLLGMSAMRRGSMDTTVSKMLCLHIPALLPPGFSDLEFPYMVQTAAVLGIGLLYQGSAHRLMTEMLLTEIGRRPTSDKCTDREGYSLAAGLGLGLVLLGRGANAVGCDDLHLEDSLCHYIEGGGKDAAPGVMRAKGGRNQWEAGGAGRRRGVAAAGTGSGGAIASANKCSCLKEGEMVNVEVTAPGAILALGLIFLKSNNASVASRSSLSVPVTAYGLDYVRPDFLLLRVVARALIMWDSVEASVTWVEDHVPPIMSKHIITGFASFPSHLPGASIAARKRQERQPANLIDMNDDDDDDEDIDFQAIILSYCNVIAGACMALGLRYAGSASPSAYHVLSYYFRQFLNLRARKLKSGVGIGGRRSASQLFRVDHNTLETCLSVCGLALSIVMAGTGHLDTFRLLRSMRIHNSADANGDEDDLSKSGGAYGHGYHMALHMAIGFLFLGGGRCSLSTSNSAIAALVCALYPRFPAHSQDNRYHAQPLRHLYVLAAENRCIETREVTSGQACYVPLTLHLKATKEHAAGTVNVLSPCLLPEFHRIAKISVSSPRFWPLEVDVDTADGESAFVLRQRVLFVKRKTGYFSYDVDPSGRRALLGRSFPLHSATQSLSSAQQQMMLRVSKRQRKTEFVSSFAAHPAIRAFANVFCQNQRSDAGGDAPESINEVGGLYGMFCTDALYECLTQEKTEVLPTYMSVFHVLQSVRARLQTDTLDLWGLKLVCTYNAVNRHRRYVNAKPLLQDDFLFFVKERLQRLLSCFDEDSLGASKEDMAVSACVRRLFASYLRGETVRLRGSRRPGSGGGDKDSSRAVGEREVVLSCSYAVLASLLVFFDFPALSILRGAIIEFDKYREQIKCTVKEATPILALLLPSLSASALDILVSALK